MNRIFNECKIVLVHSRLLEDGSNSTGNSTHNDATLLRDTFVVYGSLLVAMFLTFCYVRRAFPRAYQLRNWVSHIKVRNCA